MAIIWFTIITILLCLPGSVLPQESWIDRLWFDKWVHVFLFAVLVYLWCRFFIADSGKKVRLIAMVAIAAFLYGIIMEFVQEYFIPNRSFDITDILADGIGSLIAGFIMGRRYIKK